MEAFILFLQTRKVLKGKPMSVGSISRDSGASIEKHAVPKVDKGRQGDLDDKTSDHGESKAGDGAKSPNSVREVVFSELDLNGDGVMSQMEAIKTASKYDVVTKLFEGVNEMQHSGFLSVLV